MKITIAVLCILAGVVMTAQETPVPVDQEPLHKQVLKNDYVQVLHVTIPPARSTLFHTHSHDGVAVHLSDAVLKVDRPGKPSDDSYPVHLGQVLANGYGKNPLTHRVNNVGTTTFEVLDIEILKRPDGPMANSIAPPAAENESARVYKWQLAPGASSPQHTHQRPYLIIAATPMQLLMTGTDGSSMEHAIKPGDVHWVDSKVTHTLLNHGAEAGEIVEVELK